MGDNIHPPECGFSFCDPSSNDTCQFRKIVGEMCMYDWACYSNYCGLKVQTCQKKSTDFSSGPPLYILVPDIAGGITVLLAVIIIIVVIVCIKKQKRNVAPNPIWSSNYSNYRTQYHY